ncbi:MAG: hypothetical protein QOD86_1801 [Miltoncostaeaceae bacterium]|nr:hypothetical protein [Miltoncostaeaceae bacterium]
MEDAERRAAELAERALGHPVVAALPGAGGLPIVAGSVVGDPPRARLAWVAETGEVIARVSCPPGRPSRWRPVVAASVGLESPADRVLAARLAPEAVAMRPVIAGEEVEAPATPARDGLALVRIGPDAIVIAVDALDERGEPIGRLIRAGVAELRVDGASVGGRLGATHGMAAGIGGGRWATTIADASFEAGFEPWLPAWVPPGLERGPVRVEPDIAYPAAPPALILTWSGAETARVLVRQAPAPLASPDTGGRGAREVPVGDAMGVLRGRGLATLVWETPERAFGVQVRGMPQAVEVALRVARSIDPTVVA